MVRPHRITLALVGLVALGCSTIAEGPMPGNDDEVFDDPMYGYETPQFQPNGMTFAAIELEGHYERIAVGNLARPISAPGCCLDYVLAGPEVEDVRIVFGGGRSDGLVFLDDRPDESYELGPLDDVLLLDLDEDGRNDLVGLQPEQEQAVIVRLGIAEPAPEGPVWLSEGNSYSTLVNMQGQPMAAGFRDFAAGDLDCDGHVDLAIASPGSNAVVTMLGRGDGSFKTAETEAAAVADNRGPVRVLIAQLDGEGGDDVATANDDGSMSVLLADGCTGSLPQRTRLPLKPLTPEPCVGTSNCWKHTDTAIVATGDFCEGPSPDLAYAVEEQIWIVCGDAGQFDAVGEQAHGEAVPNAPAADYFFDLDGQSAASPNGQIDDALVWQDTLYVLRLPSPGLQSTPETAIDHAHRLVRLAIDPSKAEQGHVQNIDGEAQWIVGEVVLTLFTESPRIVLHPAALDDATLRLAWPDLGMARWEQP